jgi:hypothetical protein
MADLRPVYVAGDGDVKGPASSSDNELPLYSGSTGKIIKGSGTVVTTAGRALLDDTSAAEQRATLGLGSAALVNSTAAGNALMTNSSPAAQRATLELGTAALVNSTAAGEALMTNSSAAAQRATLGLGSAALVNSTAAGNALMTAANAAAQRTALVLGTAAQLNYGTTGASLVVAADAAAGRAALALGTTAQVDYSGPGVNMLVSVSVAAQRTLLGLGTAALVNYSAVGLSMFQAGDAAGQRALLSLGSAALRNVITSNASLTAGDVLTVGAYGLGATGGAFPATYNANSLSYGGNWRVSAGSSNLPPGMTDAIVTTAPGGDIFYQSTSNYQNSRFYFRTCSPSAWNVWREPVTGRATSWLPLVSMAGNWSASYNLGTQRQGNMVDMVANLQMSSNFSGGQNVAIVQHPPATNVNFVAEYIGNNGAAGAAAFSIRTDGVVVFLNASGATCNVSGVASTVGVAPTFPIGFNLHCAYRTADGGASND